MGEFALEGRVSLVDLMPMHLTPSRSIGPPDPDAPEFTWLAGRSPAPVDRVMAPQPQQAPVRQPALAPAPPSQPNAGEHEAPLSMAALAAQLAASGGNLILLDDDLCSFGGELLQISPDEMDKIMAVVLDAYDRVLSERARALRDRHLQARRSARAALQEPGSAGTPLVSTPHRPQEEGDQPPETV